jgi:hypothetical protein
MLSFVLLAGNAGSVTRIFLVSQRMEMILFKAANFVHRRLTLQPPLWSSGQISWLLTLRSRVRFPALPDFSE